MKKVKLMLLSFVLVATAGGLLAFKAKYHTMFCSKAIVLGRCDAKPNCDGPLLNSTIVDAGGQDFCWTITDNPPQCDQNPNCNVSTHFDFD